MRIGPIEITVRRRQPVEGEPVRMVDHMNGRHGDQPVPAESTSGPAVITTPVLGTKPGNTPVPGEPVGDV